MKIVEKIKKLLALAGNNPNLEEAESAMLHAQNLLARHGLSMADLPEDAGTLHEMLVLKTDGQPPFWKIGIIDIVAQNFRCHAFMQQFKVVRGIVMIGNKQDLEVAMDVVKLAIDIAEKQASKYAGELRDEATAEDDYLMSSLGFFGLDCGPTLFASPERREAVKNDYLRGWLSGLQESFRKNIQEMGTELALVRPSEIDEFLEKATVKPGDLPKEKTAGDVFARFQGQNDGSKFHYAKQLSAPEDDPE